MELTNINEIYNSCKPTIISAINLLNTDPSLDGHVNSYNNLKRSLLPFLENALRWLTGTATTKDVNSIKEHVNQLTESQSTQQETLVHIVSILNITLYAAQVNKHSINILMDEVDETSHDINNLCNLTTSLATNLSYHQLILYIRSVLANLWDSLSYIRMVSTHTMDYIDAAMSGTLSPHILPIMDLKIITHRKNLTIYITSTSFIRGYTALLLIPLHAHFNCQQAVPTPYRCTNSGSITTTFHLHSFHFGYLQW